MMEQKWKQIEGYSQYRVSNNGLVESAKFFYKRGEYHLLKNGINKKTGYATVVCIDEKNKKETLYVHRLVAKAFIPNKDNKRSVNHKNGIKTDNRMQNLEWVTPSENFLHAINNSFFEKKMGSDTAKCLLNEIKAENIFKEKGEYKEIAYKYGVSVTCIADIKIGRTWNHVTKLPLKRKIKSMCV